MSIHCRVLVVEDNLDTLHTFAHLLRAEGCRVQLALNGYAALDKARSFRPDVVLLDLGIPGPDGFEVCSQIKSDPDTRDACVIAVTAYGYDEHRLRSLAVGCELHVVKPVEPAYLLALVEAGWHRRKSLVSVDPRQSLYSDQPAR